MTNKIKYLYAPIIGFILLSVSGCKDTRKESLSKTDAQVNLSESDSVFLATSGSLAMNLPDQFNWEVFARICQTASYQQAVPGTNFKTNNVLWETWADDDLTYPSSPDPKNPPLFPVENTHKHKKLKPSTQRSFFNHAIKRNAIDFVESGGNEEVRRNEASFNFIIANNLWYTEGLAASFAKGTQGGAYNPLSFPLNAIEVKGTWKPISEQEKSSYHWNYDDSGKLYGLTALHIMTKAIPNWTWATFEWVGNNGRCADMGCHDAFGVSPGNVNPHQGATNMPSPETTDKPYEAGELTPALLQLFKKYGLSSDWKNYRLKGSQTDWIDATGRTIYLGNSITEDGFVATSSCISCHANASFDSVGQPANVFLPNGQSPHGPADTKVFWKNGKQIRYQGDFVWGLIAASPISQPSGNKGAKK